MRRMVLAPVMIVVLVLGGCSDDSSSSPTMSTSADSESSSTTSGSATTLAPGGSRSAEEAVLTYMEAAAKEQWGRVWDGLHPDQKALFTREAFIDCAPAAPSFSLDDVDVVDTHEENTPLEGVSESVPSTAVDLRIAVSAGEEEDTGTLTLHAFEVDGQWWTSVGKGWLEACT